jgi:molecular chaperone DnaK
MMRVKIAAEQCKIALSENEEHEIELPFLYRKKDQPSGYSEKIRRTAFEDMIRDMVYSTSQQVKTALFDAELSPDDIGLTLLVGGSTRIPLVTNFLSDSFDFSPETLVDPDLAVVRGAAIQAGVLSGVLDENAIVLTDICPYSLGTEVLDEMIGRITRCDILIKRNTTLPASVSKIYDTVYDNQRSVHVTAYQGESEVPEENYLLNKFNLSPIPKAKAGKEHILIAFSYDLNGILTVSAEIVSTGKSVTVSVDTQAAGKNLDLSEWSKSPAAKKYRQLINKAERLVKAYDDEAEGAALLANELKKGIVLEWDGVVLDSIADELKDEINDIEE